MDRVGPYFLQDCMYIFAASSHHGPAAVVLSVIGGLVLVTAGLVIYVKVLSVRNRGQHIETADFDFHPHLPDHSQSASASISSFFSSLLGKLKHAWQGNNANNRNISINMTMSSPGDEKMKNYGSFGASLDASFS